MNYKDIRCDHKRYYYGQQRVNPIHCLDDTKNCTAYINYLKSLENNPNIDYNNLILTFMKECKLNLDYKECFTNIGILFKDLIIGEKLFNYMVEADLGKLIINNKSIYTQTNFNNLYKYYNNINLLKKFLDYKFMVSDSEQFEKFVFAKGSSWSYRLSLRPDITDMLLDYGYPLNKQDLYLLTKHKYTIPNIKQYDLQLDQEFYEYCTSISFNPYNIKGKITTSLLEKALINKEPIQSIRSILKDLNTAKIKPDMKCLEAACLHRNNNAVIKLIKDLVITSKDIKVSEQCYINLCATYADKALAALK